LSIVFDARKNAEHSRRIKKATEGNPPFPNARQPAPDVKNSQSPLLDGTQSACLGLRVERRALDWRIRWNPDAATDSKRGRLSIIDGPNHFQSDLDSTELLNGTVVYSPLTNDVLIRLELGDGEAQSRKGESLRVISSQIAPPAAPGTELQAVSNLQAGPAARSARSNGMWVMNTRSQEKCASAPVVRTLLRTRVPERQGSIFSPAKLLSRCDPVFPAGAIEKIPSAIVDLRFRVSPEGKVYDVKVQKGSPLLASAAIETVKAWLYEPARLKGLPIDSQVTAALDFTPEGRRNAPPASEESSLKPEDNQHV
jgi:TonB family protein